MTDLPKSGPNLDTDAKGLRERLRGDALATWAKYQSTGRHVTAEEADAWLGRLEAGEGAEPPTPHP